MMNNHITSEDGAYKLSLVVTVTGTRQIVPKFWQFWKKPQIVSFTRSDLKSMTLSKAEGEWFLALPDYHPGRRALLRALSGGNAFGFLQLEHLTQPTPYFSTSAGVVV